MKTSKSSSSDTLRAIAATLGLCRQCESKLTRDRYVPPSSTMPPSLPTTRNFEPTPEIDADVTHQRPVNDVRYHRSILSDVRIIDCDLQAFTLKNCELENVTFRLCQFSNVVFEGLKLKDVTFFNVDFQNIWLKEVALEGAIWTNDGVRHAFITGDMFEQVPETTVTVALRSKGESRLTRTTWFQPSDVQAVDDVEADSGNSCISIVAREVGLFHLPPEVISRILEYLFPCQRRPTHGSTSTLMMLDRPAMFLDPTTSQTRYTTRSPHGWSNAPATYHAWQYSSKTDITPLRFTTSLLCVGRKFYELSIPCLYDRIITFATPEQCLAFLHDHQRLEHALHGIKLHYTSQTNPSAWRRLFDILVHTLPNLRELTVIICKEFWDTTRWMQRAEDMLVWQGWQNLWKVESAVDVQRPVLRHATRIPGSRLRGDKKMAPVRAEHVAFYLHIEDTVGHHDREGFVDEVQFMLRQTMLRTPKVAEPGYQREECCGVKNLSRCCYWVE